MTKSSPLASRAATQALLDRYGLSTKKALGQHFLVDDGIIDRSLRLAELKEGEHVLEVGPGIGVLTLALLAQGAEVTAVERDRDLTPILEELTEPYQERFRLMVKDALKLTEMDFESPHPSKLIANLPYGVAATLVLALFERFDWLSSATVMVQAEVADRMAASPGGKDYGAYTVKLALYAHPDGRFKVGPQNFFPPPRVDSAVIRLTRWAPGTPCGDLSPRLRRLIATLADGAFAARRKTLLNSVRQHLSGRLGSAELSAALPSLLAELGIDPRRRGESLSVEDFIALGRSIDGHGLGECLAESSSQ